ncbi:MAG: YihY/virulence factor BrkB family protein [Verrucomicrobia bacterium]|nr:MAG: YihY/virulence factor BrkB family protein [Verrucomicrobiota bacterium]
MKNPSEYLARIRELFTDTIWRGDVLEDHSPKGRLYAVLRIAAMTWSGILENSLASRAGALSFSSMLGLGPLIALMVLVSGAVLEKSDPDFAIKQLNKALVFVAPQIKQLEEVENKNHAAGADSTAASTTAESEAGQPSPQSVNSALNDLLNSFIRGSQSKAIGIAGALALIVIVIQLFSSIENAFNEIWGVRRGRNLMLRIVFYWAAVTLGAVLAFASLTLLSASTFLAVIEDLPLGTEMRRIFQISGPGISVIVLIGLLACFYKFIPNTTVQWFSAVTGAAIVVLLLNLNNYLAFLYLRNVMLSQSLYGSLGIIPIMMLGLYVFWLFVLLGGQITYAIQNANFQSSNKAWHDLNHATRESIALLVFTLICRRFQACEPPYSTPEISRLTRMPNQILNATLLRLIQLRLVSQLPPDDDRAGQNYRYQPARPLDQIRLVDFRKMFKELGTGLSENVLDQLDPVVADYHNRVEDAVRTALGDETMLSAITRLPPVGSSQAAVGLQASATAPAG